MESTHGASHSARLPFGKSAKKTTPFSPTSGRELPPEIAWQDREKSQGRKSMPQALKQRCHLLTWAHLANFPAVRGRREVTLNPPSVFPHHSSSPEIQLNWSVGSSRAQPMAVVGVFFGRLTMLTSHPPAPRCCGDKGPICPQNGQYRLTPTSRGRHRDQRLDHPPPEIDVLREGTQGTDGIYRALPRPRCTWNRQNEASPVQGRGCLFLYPTCSLN